jgi:hypothetical protein
MSVYGLPDIERLIRERDEARARVRVLEEALDKIVSSEQTGWIVDLARDTLQEQSK